jgi:hypothetical protein
MMKYTYFFVVVFLISIVDISNVFGGGTDDLINELMKTGKFTEDEAKNFVSKTPQNGTDELKTRQNGDDGSPARDTFNVDVILSKGSPSPIKTSSEDSSVWYELVDNNQLDISNSSIVCPSNQCKMNAYADRMIFISSDDYMALAGGFNLVDDPSNGHLNPKKQKLIEQMDFNFNCRYQDIQEDSAKKTTKYICSEPDNGSIRRNFNDTTYPYKFTATFELPSRHLVINATEAHENPYFAYSGHLVFKDEDGKIQVE